MKLGLGTVQFGLDYGISNREGQTAEREAARILSMAAENGVGLIDTAALYGNSEEVLGRTLPAGHSFKIVTKSPIYHGKSLVSADAGLLEETFRRSLVRMRQSSLYGLLIHHTDDLLAENGGLLMDRMLALKDEGLVSKIGVSVYDGEQIDRFLDRYPVDIVQVPVNVLDQRLAAGGRLKKLKRAGIEVHARSVFLQGLLLMEPQRLPPHFDRFKSHLENYHSQIRSLKISPVGAALGYLMGLEEIDVVLCGVNNHRQFRQILGEISDSSSLALDFDRFALNDPEILNPSRWKA